MCAKKLNEIGSIDFDKIFKMGKRKHNVKGRQVKDVIVDNSETKKVNYNNYISIPFTSMSMKLIDVEFFVDKIGFDRE